MDSLVSVCGLLSPPLLLLPPRLFQSIPVHSCASGLRDAATSLIQISALQQRCWKGSTIIACKRARQLSTPLLPVVLIRLIRMRKSETGRSEETC